MARRVLDDEQLARLALHAERSKVTGRARREAKHVRRHHTFGQSSGCRRRRARALRNRARAVEGWYS